MFGRPIYGISEIELESDSDNVGLADCKDTKSKDHKWEIYDTYWMEYYWSWIRYEERWNMFTANNKLVFLVA
jgi:hypothetical protein